MSQHVQPGTVDLAAFRESRGIAIQEIARETRIGVRYLQAIERSQFHKLPGGVYNVSYIRQYAAVVGLDPGPLLDLYHSRMPRERPRPEKRKTAPRTGFLELLWSVWHRGAA